MGSFEHDMRLEQFDKVYEIGKVDGGRGRGRPRIKLVETVKC